MSVCIAASKFICGYLYYIKSENMLAILEHIDKAKFILNARS